MHRVIYRAEYQKQLELAAGEIAQRLVEEIDPDRVILFGSVAAQEAGPESDVDLIVVKDSNLTFKERMRRIYTGVERSVDVDVFWYTPSELDRLKKTSSFVRHALSTGKVLYERP